MKRIGKILSFINLFFFTSILIYTLYRSQKFSNHLDYYDIFFLISILGIIFWLIVILKFSEKKRFYISLIFSGLVLYCYLLEFTHLSYSKFILKKKSYFELYSELKLDNKKIVPSFPASYFLRNEIKNKNFIFNLGGVSLSKTLLCNEYDDDVIYHSDRYGFNNNDSNWDKKKIDIIFIGDSFIHGHCVFNEDNISNQVKKITGKSYLNLAIIGNGPLIELATLKEYGNLNKPNYIIWQFYEGNDLEELKYERKSLLLNKYINKDFTQNLHLKQSLIDDQLLNKIFPDELKKIQELKKKRIFDEFKKFLKLTNLRVIISKQFLKNFEITKSSKFTTPEPIDNFDQLKYFNEIILEAKRYTEDELNAEFIFLYIPSFYRYEYLKNSQNIYNSKQIISFLKNNNIKYLNVHDQIFSKLEDPLALYPTRSFGHLGKEAYKLIAKNLEIFFN